MLLARRSCSVAVPEVLLRADEEGAAAWRHNLRTGRVCVAPPGPHQGHAVLLQAALPRRRVRVLHHPHLPQWPDRLHAVQFEPCECHPLCANYRVSYRSFVLFLKC